MCLIITIVIATNTAFVIVTCRHIIVGIIFIGIRRRTVTQSRCVAGHCHRRTGPAPKKAHIARYDGHLLLLLFFFFLVLLLLL